MIYFTSDTHFNHTNIIKYCCRPFKSTNEMNETIINNWNSVVTPEDTTYHLGDFGWPEPQHHVEGQSLIEIIQRLNGDIRLIKGNHDRKPTMKEIEQYVYIVYNNFTLKIGNIEIILNHYGLESHRNTKNKWLLFGHDHEKDNPIITSRKKINVGVDGWNFTPVSIDRIKKIISTKNCLTK